MGDAYKRGYDRILWKPAPPKQIKQEPSKRAAFATPMVIGDTMPPTEHIDGKFYESKAQFRAVTKAHGCIEVGNDPARLRKPEKPKVDKAGIQRAVRNAAARAGL